MKYRAWRIGDPPIEEVDKRHRGWGNFGIVYWKGTDRFGHEKLEAAVDYLNGDGEMIRAAERDLEVLNEQDQ